VGASTTCLVSVRIPLHTTYEIYLETPFLCLMKSLAVDLSRYRYDPESILSSQTEPIEKGLLKKELALVSNI